MGSSVLVGAATGLRSSSGLAALCLAGPSGRLSPLLRRTDVRAVSALLWIGELVADKLPSTPDRTQATGLVPRIALGAVTAGQLSRGTGASTAIAGLGGSASAVGAAFGGLALRRRLSGWMGPVQAALLEDVVCVTLAGAALVLSQRAAAPTADPEEG